MNRISGSRRLLLVQAPLGRRESPIYPLGLALLAAVAPKEYSVRSVDPNQIGESESLKILDDFRPHVIGISLRNIDSQMRRDLFYYYIHLKKFIKRVKEIAPDAVLILGGSGFSLFPRKIMIDNPWVDFGVYLEAEESFNEILSVLSHSKNPREVRGIFYRKDNQVHFSGKRACPDIKTIPIPRYDTLDPRPYVQYGGIGVQTKRGCPLSCIYCTYPHLNGTCYRLRPLHLVMEELEILVEEYGVRKITFVDGVVNLPMNRTYELLDMMKMKNWNLIWHGWFTEKNFTKDFALLCKETGCREFSFSPDGFSKATLNALGKTISHNDILNVVRIAKDVHGIRIAFNFFWNPPEQDIRTFFKMLGFALYCKLKLREKSGGIIFGNMRIEPNTPLWKRAVDEGVIDSEFDLLPEDLEGLKRTFYSNPSTRYLDGLFHFYSGLWRMKNMIRRLLKP